MNKEDLLKIKTQVEYVTNKFRENYPVTISSEKKEKGLIVTMKIKGFLCITTTYISSDEFGDVYNAFGADYYSIYWTDILTKLKDKLSSSTIKYGICMG